MLRTGSQILVTEDYSFIKDATGFKRSSKHNKYIMNEVEPTRFRKKDIKIKVISVSRCAGL
jgi:hypothetical protein